MEFLVDLLVEFLIQFVVDLFFESVGRRRNRGPVESALLATAGYFALGAAVGGASLLVFPEHFIRSPMLRAVNMFAAPAAAGGAMVLVGRLRRREGAAPVRLDRFLYAATLAFGVALVRFAFAR